MIYGWNNENTYTNLAIKFTPAPATGDILRISVMKKNPYNTKSLFGDTFGMDSTYTN
jgi:hypothetical protein